MPLQAPDTALVQAWVTTAREDVAVLCMRLADHDLSPSEWATQTATVLEELEQAVSAHALRAWPTADAPALQLAGELATTRGYLAALAPQAAFIPDTALAAMPAQLVPALLDADTLDARRPKDGRNGQDGAAGRNGIDGLPGERGPEGAKGTDGRDGLDGRAGVDGKDGARGPQGEPGVRGPQGERGVEGPPGQDGQDGLSAVRWRGQWTARTAYVRGDIVGYRGSSYVALVEHTGRRPSESPGTWDLVAAKGDKGDRGPRGPAGKDGARGPGGIGGAGMTGPQGPPGPQGEPGTPGAGGTFAVPAIALGTAAVEGVSTDTIRADASIKAFDTTAPTTSAFGDLAAVGTVDFAARRDHVHGRETENPVRVVSTPMAATLTLPSGHDIIVPITGTSPAVTLITPAASGTRVTLEFASTGGVVSSINSGQPFSTYTSIARGTLTLESDGTQWIEVSRFPQPLAVPTVALGTAAVEGTAATAVRTDATIAAFDATDPTTQALGDAAAVGTAAKAARRDHKHGMPSFATPSIALGSSAAAGSATTPIRSDGTIAAFDATAPVTQAFGDAAAVGSAAFAARRDHKHGMPTIALANLPTITQRAAGLGATGGVTTTATFASPAAIVDPVVNMTTAGGDVLFWWSAVVSHSVAGSFVTVYLAMDGVQVGSSQNVYCAATAGTYQITMHGLITGVSAAAHAFQLYWFQNGGTATANGTVRSITLLEVRK